MLEQGYVLFVQAHHGGDRVVAHLGIEEHFDELEVAEVGFAAEVFDQSGDGRGERGAVAIEVLGTAGGGGGGFVRGRGERVAGGGFLPLVGGRGTAARGSL